MALSFRQPLTIPALIADEHVGLDAPVLCHDVIKPIAAALRNAPFGIPLFLPRGNANGACVTASSF
jgi:hypothetical protein